MRPAEPAAPRGLGRLCSQHQPPPGVCRQTQGLILDFSLTPTCRQAGILWSFLPGYLWNVSDLVPNCCQARKGGLKQRAVGRDLLHCGSQAGRVKPGSLRSSGCVECPSTVTGQHQPTPAGLRVKLPRLSSSPSSTSLIQRPSSHWSLS